jgi:hypothetical protein
MQPGCDQPFKQTLFCLATALYCHCPIPSHTSWILYNSYCPGVEQRKQVVRVSQRGYAPRPYQASEDHLGFVSLGLQVSNAPNGAVGLTLASPTGPTYCQCPNPYLDAATEVALVLSAHPTLAYVLLLPLRTHPGRLIWLSTATTTGVSVHRNLLQSTLPLNLPCLVNLFKQTLFCPAHGWSSGDKWCECPNIDTLPDPTRQVKTTWDSSALVCKCPDTPDGAIGLVLSAGTPVYCECPNPTLDPTIEVPLTLSGTDSCVCPAPDIANITREVNLVIGSGNDRCVCPSKST